MRSLRTARSLGALVLPHTLLVQVVALAAAILELSELPLKLVRGEGVKGLVDWVVLEQPAERLAQRVLPRPAIARLLLPLDLGALCRARVVELDLERLRLVGVDGAVGGEQLVKGADGLVEAIGESRELELCLYHANIVLKAISFSCRTIFLPTRQHQNP